MTSTTPTNVVQKDKAGLQELAEPVPDLDQDGVSLYTNSSQDKKNEQVDNLDDSLCADEESNCLVPTKDLTQVTSDESIIVNNEKTENYSLVDELFDDPPIVSQSASSNGNVNFVNESFEKKIAPLFTSAKKKKRFQTPVQSITDETACKADNGKSTPAADDAKIEKTKPVFMSGTKIKPSIGKKRKLSDANKGEDEKAPVKQKCCIEKPIQPANTDAEANETKMNSNEGADMSHNDSVEKVSSTTSGEITEKANKKKRQKKATEDKENSAKKANSCKQPVGEKTVQSGDTKTKPEKAKSVFKKPGTKSSAEKKRNPSVASKDVNDKASEPSVKSVVECQPANIDVEVNFNVKEIKEGTDLLSNDSVKNLSSITDKDNSLLAEKVNKKKRKKKATEGKEEDTGIKKMKKATGSKKEADASKKKAAQQQAKIDMSCKNLDREQRKAEKELQKISRELEKVRKQKGSKEKKVVETSEQPSDNSSSSGQLWVQCDQPECLKWRRLKDCKNPSDIPEKWFCSMNPDQKFNSCAAPEEDSSDLSDSQEYVYATYAPGALVSAKVTGYPWWPAMIQYDTNKDAFYEKHPSCHTPIAYHVVFFGKPVSRAWVHSLCLQAFLPDDDPNTKVAQKYNNPLAIAVKQADEASQVSVEERLAKYSFDKLYTGKSMYIDDQWASGKERKKRKIGAPKKTQDSKS